MKKHNYLLLLFLFFLSQSLYGQEKTKYYQLKTNWLINECSNVGNTANYNLKELPKGARFSIVSTVSGEVKKTLKTDSGETETKDVYVEYYIIRFSDWTVDKSSKKAIELVFINEKSKYSNLNGSQKQKAVSGVIKKSNLSINEKRSAEFNFDYSEEGLPRRYFRIEKADLSDLANEVVRGLDKMFGTVTYPIKIREDFSFTKDITLSAMGGIKYNFNKDLSLGAALGVGITSVTLDSLSTGGAILKNSERAGFSLPIALILEYKKVQFSIATGFDFLPASSRDNWCYHGKPWFAIGIGFSVFSSTEKPNNGKNQK